MKRSTTQWRWWYVASWVVMKPMKLELCGLQANSTSYYSNQLTANSQ